MVYKMKYKTPSAFSDIIITSDGKVITSLYFETVESKKKETLNYQEKYLPVFKEVIKWLDIYFSGNIPKFTPKYKLNNLTDFRSNVISIMTKIPYGKTLTYKDISKELVTKNHLKKMSSQAVGGAISWNPILIIIPCHRVIGSDKSLTGYSGGIENKKALLKLEGHSLNKFKN